jgi:hypothetical protein
VTGAWLAVRAARRRLRRWPGLRAAAPWLSRGAVGAVGVVASSPVVDRRWWLAQRRRHQVWRAVSGAERAVRAAESAGAPTGDLRHLVRQLRHAARSVDAALRACGPAGATRSAGQEAAGIIATAEEISRVASDALLSVARPEAAGIVAAVEIEVAALRHGLAAAAAQR